MTEKKSNLLPHMDFVQSDDIWDKKSAKLWKEASFRHQGRIKLITKRDSKFWLVVWTIIHYLVQIVTFGKGFHMVDGPYTTFGPLIFLPGHGEAFRDMDSKYRYSLLKHEIAHVDHMFLFDPDAQDKGTGPRPLWFNILIWGWALVFAVAYLIFPLPYGFAWFRAWAEYHGYKRNLHTYAQNRIAWSAVHELNSKDFLINKKETKSVEDWDEGRFQLRLMVIDGTKNFAGSSTEQGHKEWYHKQFTSWNYGKMLIEKHFEWMYAKMLEEVIRDLASDSGIDETLRIAESYYAQSEEVQVVD